MNNDRVPARPRAHDDAPSRPQPASPRAAQQAKSGDESALGQVRTALAVIVVFAGVFVVGIFGFRGAKDTASNEPPARPVAVADPQPRPLSPDLVVAPIPVHDPSSVREPDTVHTLLERESLKQGNARPADVPAVRTPLEPNVLFARSSPAVVQVVVSDRHGTAVSSGSGFLISAKGLIATNYHVIEKAHSAQVVFADKSKVAVLGVAAFDKDADIAIIAFSGRIDAQPLELAGAELPAVGVKVYAIGNPLGLSNTLSDGLVSGHRILDKLTEIQTTAPISPGSSGGPLLAADGRVVAVTTSTIRAGQNINFAVPVSHVTRLLLQWENKKGLVQFPLTRQPDRRAAVSAPLLSGFERLKNQDYDRAIKDFNEAIRLDPDSSVAHSSRGLAWYGMKEFDRAIKDYTEAIRLDPKDPHIYSNRGNAWAKKTQYEKAIADYDRAIKIDPKVDTFHLNRGRANSANKEHFAATNDFTAAIRLEPSEPFYYVLRGVSWYDQEDYDKAIGDFTAAIRINPKTALYFSLRGRAWYAKRNYANAKKDFDEAERLRAE